LTENRESSIEKGEGGLGLGNKRKSSLREIVSKNKSLSIQNQDYFSLGKE
jgi:hypothetical protein